MSSTLLIGSLAAVIQLLLLAWPHDRLFHPAMAVAMLLWTAHYGLIGAEAGAAMHALAAANLAMVTIYRLRRRPMRSQRIIAAVFSLAAIGLGLHFYRGMADLLVIAGQVSFVCAQTLFKGSAMRRGIIIGNVFFAGFAYTVLSVPGMVMCTASIAAAAIGIFSGPRRQRLVETPKGRRSLTGRRAPLGGLCVKLGALAPRPDEQHAGERVAFYPGRPAARAVDAATGLVAIGLEAAGLDVRRGAFGAKGTAVGHIRLHLLFSQLSFHVGCPCSAR